MLFTTFRQKSMIHQLLHELGFSGKEIQVYLTILEQGKIAPSDIAKLTKIKRTTVYNLTKELIKKGVIREDLGSKVRYLVALPPEELANLVKIEEVKLKKRQKLTVSAIEALKSYVKNDRYFIPKITFVEEDGIKAHLESRQDAWNESTKEHGGIWWGFQDDEMEKKYGYWGKWSWKAKTAKGLESRIIVNDEKLKKALENQDYPHRRVLTWRHSNDFSNGMWIAGEYMIVIITEQRPHYLIEVHDKSISHNMREIFKGIWQCAENAHTPALKQFLTEKSFKSASQKKK